MKCCVDMRNVHYHPRDTDFSKGGRLERDKDWG